jgi:FkbM family methyltransferase
MEQTFRTPFGEFTFDVATNWKMASLFNRYGYSSKEDFEVLKKYLKKDSVVVDIGACIGTLTIPLSKLAKEVHAFEPELHNLSYLRRNIEANKCKNITIHPLALGSKKGKVTLAQPDTTSIGSGTIIGTGDISMVTLDSLNISPHVIKVDVEGFEPKVFEGAKKTLEHWPIIYFEFHLPQLRAHGKWPIYRLNQLLKGYVFYVEDKRTSLLGACLRKEPKYLLTNIGSGTTFNVLALPKNYR